MMKRLHLQIIYGLLWILTSGFFLINADYFRQLAVSVGQAMAIARFMIFFGPAFFVLYLTTAFLFDVKDEILTGAHLKSFLSRRRLPIGLFLFALVVFVLLTFSGIPVTK